MAYTDHTWSSGETLTAANMNGLRDNFRLAGPHLIVRKTSDQSVTSSTTPVNDTALVAPVGASEVWYLEWVLRFGAPTTAVGISVQWTFPASGVLDANLVWASTAGSPSNYSTTGSTSPTTAWSLGAVASAGTTSNVCKIPMIYVNSTTAGSVTLQWAQVSSNATATVMKTNSTLWGTKLA